MNPSSHLIDLLNTPDFWLFLLCSEFMGEDRFREFLESMKQKGVIPEGGHVEGGDYHESRTESS